MRFAYYERLSRKEQAVYRKSDALVDVSFPKPRDLRVLVPDIERALLADDRKSVQAATSTLVDAMLAQLNAPPVKTKVLAVRPGDDGGELHGLYEAVEGETAEIKVWMRTHAKKKPVAKKSFVRTVVHEVCHHLDYFVLDIDPSFHTSGFFRREAALSRQLLRDPADSLALQTSSQPRVDTAPTPATTATTTAPARKQLTFEF